MVPSEGDGFGLIGDVGVGFDFDHPFGVEEAADDEHGGSGKDEREEFAMDAGDRLPVCCVCEEDACAVDVLDGGAGLFEGFGDEGEALIGLGGGIFVLAADWPGAGDVDVIADADGSGEADDGLVWAGAGNVGAGCHAGWMRGGAPDASARLAAFIAQPLSTPDRICVSGFGAHATLSKPGWLRGRTTLCWKATSTTSERKRSKVPAGGDVFGPRGDFRPSTQRGKPELKAQNRGTVSGLHSSNARVPTRSLTGS